MTWHRRILQLLAAVVACLWSSSSVVYAMPQMLLRNGGNKCFKVDVTADTVLLIQYTSPDLKTNNDREDRRAMTGSDGDEEAEERTKPIYDHRRTKKKSMPDMMLQMNHLVEDNGRRRSAGANKSGTRKLREDITNHDGSVEFFTGERDGFVEICVQAYMATAKDPRRFGMRIEAKSTQAYEREKEAAQSGKAFPDVPQKIQSDMMLTVETSRITKELERHKQRVQDIAGNSAASKDRQASFHESSVTLKRGVRRYPIFRICILLVAGYMQASHVVKYMRSRHIY